VHIIIQYAQRIFTRFLALPRPVYILPITMAQAKALDALRFLAAKHALGLRFRQALSRLQQQHELLTRARRARGQP
jgi:hypothetical protein